MGLFSNFIHEFNILRKNVSKNVSVSVYQGLRLGLVSGRNSNVLVSSRGNVGRSWSRSRLGLKTKCLGLISVSDLKVSFTTLPSSLLFIQPMDKQMPDGDWKLKKT